MARSARGRTRNLSLGPLVQHKPPSPRPGRNHTATSRKQTHNNTKESGLNKPTQNPGLDTYRVNLRIKGLRPPSIGLTCAVTSARATTTTNQSNFARNSPPDISDFEIRPLELQRLWAISKNDRVKLRATFAKTVAAVTLGPFYRPREPRPRLATTNSFTKNRNHHEDLQSAAPRPHGPLQNASPRPLTFVMAPPASKDTSGLINTSANWVP